jgi:hypothetical protein
MSNLFIKKKQKKKTAMLTLIPFLFSSCCFNVMNSLYVGVHTFYSREPGDLSFEKGEVIAVTGRGTSNFSSVSLSEEKETICVEFYRTIQCNR